MLLLFPYTVGTGDGGSLSVNLSISIIINMKDQDVCVIHTLRMCRLFLEV